MSVAPQPPERPELKSIYYVGVYVGMKVWRYARNRERLIGTVKRINKRTISIEWPDGRVLHDAYSRTNVFPVEEGQ